MIVTELMVKSFHDLSGGAVDLVSKIKMAKEAAKGISWLHSLTPAIIHRDLKPENILIDQTGTGTCSFLCALNSLMK
jgi:serine/threonine protein kinase